ncbi:sigma-54-dependent transcriptional regulator [Pseudazoarcus pumilus]|uniref:Sigma-54-dependent Fis family transcriptional regulator n=1 Tax=Pseudazoarcus pumilus TaxID=2067960 RepID=A0A2I6S8I4_9RHOO|nr:sigma-54 dependent transcriptional regulator [Pseudazoarcus pumilus]AUN95531.1 sigma-54-dependent Fis family transcriptional regulator [Pseudazoarcus pumilus]
MSEAIRLLVVEDDAALRDAVCMTLEMAGHHVVGVDGGPPALDAIATEPFDLVISDLRMQPMDGLELLGAIRARLPQMPVLLMTAYGDVEKAVAAMRGGACDFLMKPFEPEGLLGYVRRYAHVPSNEDEVVAGDPRTRQLLQMAARVASSDATVLLTGESGTGKEVFAHYIHAHSPRAARPFVAINCAAIPENLLEATLFGYEKGSFTGAQVSQAGKFEQAQGGTLLLDEISEMPLALQAKLLRVLQEREVERVGGRKSIDLDIRVLATSNRDMASEVAAGRFREDLYYRLNVFPLAIPALRERPGDILPLAAHFLSRHAAAMRRSARLDPGAEAALVAHAWPGNVRELENAMQRALILAPAESIDAATLSMCLPAGAISAAPASMGATPVAPSAIAAAPGIVAGGNRPDNMKDLEREHILTTLREVGGSRKLAVERLGISERTLRYKLQQYRAEGHDC